MYRRSTQKTKDRTAWIPWRPELNASAPEGLAVPPEVASVECIWAFIVFFVSRSVVSMPALFYMFYHTISFNVNVCPSLITYYNMTSFFHFVNKRAIYRLGILSLAHALVHVTNFPVDELSSARIW